MLPLVTEQYALHHRLIHFISGVPANDAQVITETVLGTTTAARVITKHVSYSELLEESVVDDEEPHHPPQEEAAHATGTLSITDLVH